MLLPYLLTHAIGCISGIVFITALIFCSSLIEEMLLASDDKFFRDYGQFLVEYFGVIIVMLIVAIG